MTTTRHRRLLLIVNILVALLPWLGSQRAVAQPFEWRGAEPFQIVHPTSSPPRLNNPLSGGINRPVFQLVDIEGDNVLDLFVLDIDGKLNYYRGLGVPASQSYPSFHLGSISYFDVPVESWFKFVDIDADGDYDLYTGGPSSSVKFIRNVGGATQPFFLIEEETVRDTSGNPVLSESISVPTFADVDGDGDLDFFSGNSAGTIWYYENIGSRLEPRFRFVTDKYQGIEIIGATGRLADSAPTTLSPAAKQARHGAMAITFADIENDGDLDMFWGDFFNRSLYFLENRGTRTLPQFVLRDSTYQKPNIVLTDGFNMPQFVDLDGDGVGTSDLDMVIAVLYGTATINNFLVYLNVKSPFTNEPTFQLATQNFLQTFDVGAASSPVFVDLDGDLDLDMVVGSEDGRLLRYDRFGVYNQFSPTARYQLNAFPQAVLSGVFNSSPTMADIDGDGRLDLLVGDANGRLHYFNGTNFLREDTTFALRNVSFGQNASPWFVDVERRGLIDLFVGTGGGKVIYYRNTGTRTAPRFTRNDDYFVNLDSIDVGDDAKPAFGDFTGDPWPDLVIGARDGSLRLYRNDNRRFTYIPDFFAGIPILPRVAPAPIDIDNNGVPDLVLGNYKGGLLFYYNKRTPGPVSVDQQGSTPASFILEQNYPNPFNPQTTIRYELASESSVRLSVLDLLGREVAELVNERQQPGTYSIVFDAGAFPSISSGLLMYRLRAEGLLETKKMLFLK